MRIIYLSPFAPTEVSGGIKTAYRHVEILTRLGFDAFIWQPEGHPVWLQSEARLIQNFDYRCVSPEDILVYPEVLNSIPDELVTTRTARKKIIFCQNQYYIFNKWIPKHSFRELGFDSIMCSSEAVKCSLENIFSLHNLKIVPYFIDENLFKPGTQEEVQICMIYRKVPEKASYIWNALHAKYPATLETQIIVLSNASESHVASVFAKSTILLSLSNRESLGLVPLEAMSAGCLVVGYHGYGGLEYATEKNGFWFDADQHELVVDALYKCVQGATHQAPWVEQMINEGRSTAAHYGLKDTEVKLLRYFQDLISG